MRQNPFSPPVSKLQNFQKSMKPSDLENLSAQKLQETSLLGEADYHAAQLTPLLDRVLLINRTG